MSIKNLPEDILIHITTFLRVSELQELSSVCKDFSSLFNNPEMWISRGNTLLRSKEDYKRFGVTDAEIKQYIASFTWLTDPIRLNEEKKIFPGNHLIPSMVRNISMCMLKVDKLRNLYEQFRHVESFDWKMSINKRIEMYLAISEEDKVDLQNRIEYIKKYK